jgi:hypothetical protein
VKSPWLYWASFGKLSIVQVAYLALKRPPLFWGALVMGWIGWLVAVLFNVSWIHLAVALLNVLAAFGLYHMSRNFPPEVRRCLRGVSQGVAILVLAELLLLGRSGDDLPGLLSDIVFALGALWITFYAFQLPNAIGRLGLYQRQDVLTLLTLPPGLALATVALLAINHSGTPLWLFFTFTSTALFVLFAIQVVYIRRNRLRVSLERVVCGLALVCLARLWSIIGGSDPNTFEVAVYSFLWMLGMNIIALAMLD